MVSISWRFYKSEFIGDDFSIVDQYFGHPSLCAKTLQVMRWQKHLVEAFNRLVISVSPKRMYRICIEFDETVFGKALPWSHIFGDELYFNFRSRDLDEFHLRHFS